MKNKLPEAVRSKSPDEKLPCGNCKLLVRNDEKLALTCWKDSKVVLTLSTKHGVEPLGTCKRWVKGESNRKTFPQPNAISMYNKNMGGVDLMDRMLAMYPHWAYRTNKWTVRTITHMLLFATANIWFERGKDGKFLEHLLTMSDLLLVEAKHLEDEMGLLQMSLHPVTRVPTGSQRYAPDHLPDFIGGANASRCRFVLPSGKSCGGKSRWSCTTCKVVLCLNNHKNCFKDFHMSKPA